MSVCDIVCYIPVIDILQHLKFQAQIGSTVAKEFLYLIWGSDVDLFPEISENNPSTITPDVTAGVDVQPCIQLE